MKDRNLLKNYLDRKALLASGLEGVISHEARIQRVTLLSENSDEVCDRLHLIHQEKQDGNDTFTFDDDFFCYKWKITQYNCIVPAENKKKFEINLL